MFSKAVPVAAGFTRPMVISSRTAQGACSSTIGAYVVLARQFFHRKQPCTPLGVICGPRNLD